LGTRLSDNRKDPVDSLFAWVSGFFLSFVPGHIAWLVCRAFNKVMKRLE
jgi:hypothetical protein